MARVQNNSMLLPNMLAEVHITDMNIENGVVIPSISVLNDSDNTNYVFILSKDNVVERVDVVVIEKFEGKALIEDNEKISKDSRIVVKGAKGIAEKQTVNVKEITGSSKK